MNPLKNLFFPPDAGSEVPRRAGFEQPKTSPSAIHTNLNSFLTQRRRDAESRPYSQTTSASPHFALEFQTKNNLSASPRVCVKRECRLRPLQTGLRSSTFSVRRWTFDVRIFLLSLLLLTRFSHAQTTQPTLASHQLLARVQKQLLTVTSMQSDFTQLKKLAVLKHTLKITGHVAMEKPDRFVWIVQDPVKYAIKVQGQDITQWDEDTNKVQVMHAANDPTFKAVTDQIQAWFLGDYKVLEQSYDVYLLSEKPLALRFAPKGESMVAKLIKNIEITFAPNELEIQKMVINEAAGDTTTIDYTNTHLNQPVNNDIWQIPPK